MGKYLFRYAVVVNSKLTIEHFLNFIIFSLFFVLGSMDVKAKNNASRQALKKLCHIQTEVTTMYHSLGESISADKIEK